MLLDSGIRHSGFLTAIRYAAVLLMKQTALPSGWRTIKSTCWRYCFTPVLWSHRNLQYACRIWNAQSSTVKSWKHIRDIGGCAVQMYTELNYWTERHPVVHNTQQQSCPSWRQPVLPYHDLRSTCHPACSSRASGRQRWWHVARCAGWERWVADRRQQNVSSTETPVCILSVHAASIHKDQFCTVLKPAMDTLHQ